MGPQECRIALNHFAPVSFFANRRRGLTLISSQAPKPPFDGTLRALAHCLSSILGLKGVSMRAVSLERKPSTTSALEQKINSRIQPCKRGTGRALLHGESPEFAISSIVDRKPRRQRATSTISGVVMPSARRALTWARTPGPRPEMMIVSGARRAPYHPYRRTEDLTDRPTMPPGAPLRPSRFSPNRGAGQAKGEHTSPGHSVHHSAGSNRGIPTAARDGARATSVASQRLGESINSLLSE